MTHLYRLRLSPSIEGVFARSARFRLAARLAVALAASIPAGLASASVHTVAIPGLYDTGVNGTGGLLAGGSIDPHYVLVSSADPNFPGPQAIVPSVIATGFWVPNGPASKWIAPANAEGYPSGGENHPVGFYVYRLTVDLTGFDPSSVVITGSFAADNAAGIRVNGAGTGQVSQGYNTLVAFTLNSGFVSGTNTIDFETHNGGGVTGLRVSGIAGQAATVGVEPFGPSAASALSPPRPNPARGMARFDFALTKAGPVRLWVADLAGRTVRTLVDGVAEAGTHERSWDGLHADGTRARAGVYFIGLEAEGGRTFRRLAWLP
jgi:hypothetical protein